jgi:hypothetical protein
MHEALDHEYIWGGMEIKLNTFSNSAPEGGKWTPSSSYHFTSGGTPPQYPLCRRLGGPKTLCGCYREEKVFCPRQKETMTPYNPDFLKL